MNKKGLSAVLLVLWSLAVHLPGLTSPLLDYHAHRQCQTASMARDYFRDGMHFLKPETDTSGPPTWTGTEFPLYSYTVAILYKFFGVHEVEGRLLSILLTAWSALFLYNLVSRRLGDTIGLWSGLVMCSIPTHLYFTRTFQPESMALWGFLGFAYFLDRYLSGEGTAWDPALIVALGALGPLLKLNFLYLVGGLWLVLGIESKRLRRPSYWGMLIAMVALPAAWYHYTKLAPAQVLPLGPQEQWRNLKAIFQLKFWEAHFISRFPEIDATYSGLLLGLIGARILWRDRRLMWFGWWAITAAYIVLLGEYGFIHKYTEIPWAPVNAVFIAVGIVTVWRWANSQALRRAMVVVLILGIPVHAGLRIAHWYRLERLWLFRAKATLDKVAHPGDLVLTNTSEVPVLLYYLDRTGYTIDLNQTTPQELISSLSRVRFFVTPTEGSWSRRPEWPAILASHAKRIELDPEYWIYEVKR